MNKYIKQIILLAAAAPMLCSCLDTVYPTNGMVQEQVNESTNAIDGLGNAVAQQMMKIGYGYGACGFAGQSLELDAMTGQIPIAQAGYDYYSAFSECNYLGATYTYTYDTWNLYYSIISKANLVLEAGVDVNDASDADAPTVGNALAYRALAYLYLTELYLYRNTGYSQLDAQAKADSVQGLIVPIVTESTQQSDGFENPRAPFYAMYRFILTDLNRAAKLLEGYERTDANHADAAVVNGLKARLWMWMGSQFENDPEELAEQVAHEGDSNLEGYDKCGVTTAKECFANAMKSAEAAMEGHTPLSKSEWYNATTGFNSANGAWLLAEQIASDDIKDESDNTLDDNWSWKSFTSFISADADFGVAGNASYGASRCIDAQLYSEMNAADWRRSTWIAPEDAGKATSAAKYTTDMTAGKFAKFPAYTGLKFKPGKGNVSDYKTGAAVDIPVMRVEEMYFIEAEAAAHVNGVSAGVRLLNNFMNTYRCETTSSDPTPYACSATTLSDFTQELIRQKRIEFWGEGIIPFDYKRLKMGYDLTYEGSNHIEKYQFKLKDGYVCPGLNFCIPNYELQYNKAIRNNPDPSGVLG